MNDEKNIFSAHELFNLTCAEYCANKQEEEYGISSDWSEFKGDLQGKFATLSNIDQEKLDGLLKEAVIGAKYDIESLIELQEDDFENEEEFKNERRELQKNITEVAIGYLEEYWNNN